MTNGQDQRRSPAGPSEEGEAQRTQRQMLELLNEVRVAMPGVQVLFAFLLIVPFQAAFHDITGPEKSLYWIALIASALATACFTSEAAHHRLLFHLGQREYIIRSGNRMAIAGLIALAVAMTSALGLVTDLLYGSTTARIVVVAAAIAFASLWFGAPLLRRRRILASRDDDR